MIAAVQDRTALDAILARAADPRVLELIILPTEHCNFRCVYCYEDFRIGHMRPETITGIKRWIDARAPDLARLQISWFGGEPMLALPTVLDLTAYGRDALRRSRFPEASFHAGMTTNAYRLTGEVFEQLCLAGVTDYQITLDGPRWIHDSRRLRADGAGTFDIIWSNLLAMASAAGLPPGVRVELRLHYDGRSVGHLEPLVDAICLDLLPSGIFHVKFHALERLGGPRDGEIVLPSPQDHELVRQLSQRIAQVSGSSRTHMASDVMGYICYASKANSFVVRADGRLGKCTVALNDSRNDVGHLNADGTISWNEGRIAPWLRGLESGEADVLGCPLGAMSWPEIDVARERQPAGGRA